MRQALIRPGHISHNVQALHHAAGTAESMLVVKADGYGHGALTAARAGLDGGATWLGTADIDEALALRTQGITAPILAWLIGPDSEVSEAINHTIDLGISSRGQLDQVVSQASAATPATIQLKVDSGMGRGGVVEADWADIAQAIARAQDQGLVHLRGVFTHLSLASVDDDVSQLTRFEQALAIISDAGVTPEIIHGGASVGSIRTPGRGYDLARFGIAAYGYPMTPEHEVLGLRPAMQVSGQVILTKKLPAGHGVGYDLTYRTSADTTMAVVPLGYADGVPRHASSRGPVVIGDQRFTVAGRVSMDQISIDVGDHPVEVGQWAVLWGDPSEGHPSAAEWAEIAGTIPYDVISRVGSRVPRVVQ